MTAQQQVALFHHHQQQQQQQQQQQFRNGQVSFYIWKKLIVIGFSMQNISYKIKNDTTVN